MRKAPRSQSDLCRIILLCAEGFPGREVAGRVGVHEHTVGRWRRRFAEKRIGASRTSIAPADPAQ